MISIWNDIYTQDETKYPLFHRVEGIEKKNHHNWKVDITELTAAAG